MWDLTKWLEILYRSFLEMMVTRVTCINHLREVSSWGSTHPTIPRPRSIPSFECHTHTHLCVYPSFKTLLYRGSLWRPIINELYREWERGFNFRWIDVGLKFSSHTDKNLNMCTVENIEIKLIASIDPCQCRDSKY